MNNLTTITQGLVQCSQDQAPKQMMAVFRAVTPQFYKNMTDLEIKAEYTSIQLLTQGIDNETLAEMCQRAVRNYARERSENTKTYFDMNYVLQFYKEAFNYVHCDSIQLSKECKKVSQRYDEAEHILWQEWERENGERVTIAHIQDKAEGVDRDYSPKDFEFMFEKV